MKNDIRDQILFIVIVCVFIFGCGGGGFDNPGAPDKPAEPPATIDDGGTNFPEDTRFQADNGNSSLLFEDETTVRPEVPEKEIKVHEFNPQELSERVQDTPPPDNRRIIISLEILPSNMMFAPPATVKFDVSERDDLEIGDVLELYTFDEMIKDWDLLGKADVDDEWFAVARILHTSIYALMEKVESLESTETPTPSSVSPTDTPTKTITPSVTSPPPAEISGSLWEDTNRNGSIDFGETTGIGGVTVNLGTGSCNSAGFWQTSTNSSGFYNFTNLAAGTYCVSVSIPVTCDEYTTPTTRTSYTVFLGNGQSVSKNFGYSKTICVD
jgi:hypothetical protein